MVNYKLLFQKYVPGLVLFGIVCLILSSTILYINRFCKQDAPSQSITGNAELNFKVIVQPAKYTPLMSSTPGMSIHVEYNNTYEKVFFTAERGTFLIWDSQTGRIKGHVTTLETERDRAVYWTPYEGENRISKEKSSIITVGLLEDGQKIAEKKITILFDGSFYSPEY